MTRRRPSRGHSTADAHAPAVAGHEEHSLQQEQRGRWRRRGRCVCHGYERLAQRGQDPRHTDPAGCGAPVGRDDARDALCASGCGLGTARRPGRSRGGGMAVHLPRRAACRREPFFYLSIRPRALRVSRAPRCAGPRCNTRCAASACTTCLDLVSRVQPVAGRALLQDAGCPHARRAALGRSGCGPIYAQNHLCLKYVLQSCQGRGGGAARSARQHGARVCRAGKGRTSLSHTRCGARIRSQTGHMYMCDCAFGPALASWPALRVRLRVYETFFFGAAIRRMLSTSPSSSGCCCCGCCC